jgi:hypothetical protein
MQPEIRGTRQNNLFYRENFTSFSNPPSEVSWKPKYKTRNWIESRNSKGAVVMVLVALAVATDLT